MLGETAALQPQPAVHRLGSHYMEEKQAPLTLLVTNGLGKEVEVYLYGFEAPPQ